MSVRGQRPYDDVAERKQSITATLRPEMIRALDARARMEDVSRSSLVAEAIEEYLKQK